MRGSIFWAVARIALVTIMLIGGIQYATEPAAAVDPITVGAGVTVAGLATLVGIASTYSTSATFADSCQDAGVTLGQGIVLQSMIDYAILSSCAPGSESALVVSDGRLMKAAAAYMKNGAYWGAITGAAANAVSWGGNTYYEVGDAWEGFGFGANATDPGDPAYQANTADWVSGADVSQVPGDYFSWPPSIGNSELTNYERGEEVASVIMNICEDPGYQIKGRVSRIYTDNAYWYWSPTNAVLNPNQLKCMLCGDVHDIGVGSIQIRFARTWTGSGWGPAGSEIKAYTVADYSWLLQHGDALCMPAAIEYDPQPVVLPTGDVAPTVTSYPDSWVGSAGAQTTLPSYAGRGTIPAYVPPADVWEQPNTGDGVLDGSADWCADQADTLRGISEDLAGSTAGMPDIAASLVDWLLIPLRGFLDALAAIIDALGKLLAWLAAFFESLAAWAYSLFHPNPQAIEAEFTPRWNQLKEGLKWVWPFAAVTLAQQLLGDFQAAGGDLPLVFNVTIAHAHFTMDLGAALTMLEGKRWILSAFVWGWLMVGLLLLFKPKVTA